MTPGGPSESSGSAVDGSSFAEAYAHLMRRWPGHEKLDVETAFGRTRVHVAGPADRPPLLLLHAYQATSAEWIEVVSALSGDLRVYAVDSPGDAGGSVRGDRAMATPADLVSWIDAVLDGLDLAATALCGHSYGAWIALHYAISRSDRVGRLILVDPTMTFGPLAPAYLLRAVPALLRPTAARRRSLIRWETRGAAVDPEWSDLAAAGAGAYPKAPTVPTKIPKPAALAPLRLPVTVVLGGASRVHPVRRVARNARRRLPDVRIETLDGATHYGLPLTHAADLAAVLRSVG